MAGKARQSATLESLVLENRADISLLKAMLRDRLGYASSEVRSVGTAAGNTNVGVDGYLRTDGDTMIGPIAYYPRTEQINTTDNSIDVSREKQEQFTSRLIVSTSGGGTDLDFLHGAAFAGQQMDVQGITTETFDIRNREQLSITNIVGDGATNIITVTVSSTANLTTGDFVKISATTNFNIDHVSITVATGTTFTYDLGSVGSATPEVSGNVKRGNIRTNDGNDLTVTDNQNYELVFDVVAQEWAVKGASGASGGGGGSTDLSTITCLSKTAEYVDYANWSSQEPGSIELANNGNFTNNATTARHNEIDDGTDATFTWHFNGLRKVSHIRLKVENHLNISGPPTGTHDAFMEYFDGSTWTSLPTTSVSEWTVNSTTSSIQEYDLDVDLVLSKIRLRYHHNDDGNANVDVDIFGCTIDELPYTCNIAYVDNNDTAIECHDVLPVSFEVSGFTVTPPDLTNARDGDFTTKTGEGHMTSGGTTCNGTWNFGRLRKVSHIKILVTDGRSAGSSIFTGKCQYQNSSDTWVDIDDWDVQTVKGKEQFIDQDVDFTAKALRVIWTRDSGTNTFTAEFYECSYSYIIEDCDVLNQDEALITGATYFQADVQTIASGVLDVSIDGDYVTRLIAAPEGGVADDLTDITIGDLTTDRLLMLEGSVADITIKTTGNIETIDGNDLVLADNKNIWLIFDSSDLVWRVIGAPGSGAGSGVSYPLDFPELDEGTVGSATINIDFSDSTRHSRKYTLDGDITFAFNTPPTNKTAYASLLIVQDGSGSHAVTLPVGTINKTEVENGIDQTANAETSILIKYFFGTYYAFVEGGGGESQTPWLSNIDADGFDLTDVGQIIPIDSTHNLASDANRFANGYFGTVNIGDSADFGTITGVPDGVEYDTNDAAHEHEFQINNVRKFAISNTEAQLDPGVNFDLNGNNLIFSTGDDDERMDVSGQTIRVFINNQHKLSWDLNGQTMEAGYRLTMEDHIRFTGITKPASSNNMIYAENLATDQLVFNTVSGGKIRFDENNETFVDFDALATEFTHDGTYQVEFFRSTDPSADDHVITEFNFTAWNSATLGKIFAKMEFIENDVTSGTEDGKIKFSVIDGGVNEGSYMQFEAASTATLLTLAADEDDMSIEIKRIEATSDNGRIGRMIWITKDNGGTERNFFTLDVDADDVTSGNYSTDLTLSVASQGSIVDLIFYDGTGVGQGLQIIPNNDDKIGFFGATPVGRLSVASDTLANLYSALRTYGLIAP